MYKDTRRKRRVMNSDSINNEEIEFLVPFSILTIEKRIDQILLNLIVIIYQRMTMITKELNNQEQFTY